MPRFYLYTCYWYSSVLENKGEMPVSKADVYQSQVDIGWRDFANDEELQRLSVLDARISLKRRILAETVAERAAMRRRLIQRKRRASDER